MTNEELKCDANNMLAYIVKIINKINCSFVEREQKEEIEGMLWYVYYDIFYSKKSTAQDISIINTLKKRIQYLEKDLIKQI
jgi:hypothetical protein